MCPGHDRDTGLTFVVYVVLCGSHFNQLPLVKAIITVKSFFLLEVGTFSQDAGLTLRGEGKQCFPVSDPVNGLPVAAASAPLLSVFLLHFPSCQSLLPSALCYFPALSICGFPLSIYHVSCSYSPVRDG